MSGVDADWIEREQARAEEDLERPEAAACTLRAGTAIAVCTDCGRPIGPHDGVYVEEETGDWYCLSCVHPARLIGDAR